ncbi:hypothetical protein [Frigoriflavimonas asaccharolytica]|uniref:Uncharacterized protein n=1 Tax=Frigoriflavimonas asaccharolytica TaxID=2735899 RepID=A0A8J8GC23_9FLAO|nr:hypothetical protein [Frigoriflavimonas asaccharolytica]NRS93464.1 hypothetical protein [Frigoriflavimonas asaccharolytica]
MNIDLYHSKRKYSKNFKDEFDYDKNVDFYYHNLINSLILFTYTSEELQQLEPILIDPISELYEEIDYAFIPNLFESVFRNGLIEQKNKNSLINFKTKIDEIPNEYWNYKSMDTIPIWKEINLEANNLLNNINCKQRIYEDKYVYFNTAK